MRGLIVTADDFGTAGEVNEAVELAHTQGVLTAASLMVGAPAATEAVAIARRLPDLGVGLHLVLVDGRPVLPAAELPDLVGPDGRFRDDMVLAGARMFFHPPARRQLRAEIAAQFDAFAATGLRLDHVNAHKHFQLHPTIGRFILEIGRRHGMGAVRFPIEPRDVLAQVEPSSRNEADWVVDLWAALARRRFRRAGMLVPDHVFGLRWSGAMNAARLRGLIDRLPSGLNEIYLHPAANAHFEGAATSYAYAAELAALVDEDVRRAAGPIRRGNFHDFATAEGQDRA